MVKCIRCGAEKADGDSPCPKCNRMDQSLEMVMRISSLREALTRISRGDFDDEAHAVDIARDAVEKDDALRI